MIARRVLCVVEGPHDEAFVGRLLKLCFGCRPCLKMSSLDPVWVPLVPKTFPHNDDLRKRVPTPLFYETDTVSIAIKVAVGDSQLVISLKDDLSLIGSKVDSVGVFLDADQAKAPSERFEGIRKELIKASLSPGLEAGTVGNGNPRCGVFIFPDNATQGTLESLLLDCASVVYPAAKAAAAAFVDGIDSADYESKELDELNKPSGQVKATIAAIAAILKPGKAIQNSISDNRWLCDKTLSLQKVQDLVAFLKILVTSSAGTTDLA